MANMKITANYQDGSGTVSFDVKGFCLKDAILVAILTASDMGADIMAIEAIAS